MDDSETTIDGRKLGDLFETVRAFERPVLSLYANVDPAQAENLTRPVNIRVRNTLRDLEGVPRQVARKVSEYFEQRTPEGRSVAVFAGGDQVEVVHLDLPLFDDARSDHLDARVGEPYFTPLLSAMNAYQPYLVVFVDRDRLVAYQVFLGQAEVLWDATRNDLPGNDDVGQSKNRFPHGMGNVPPPQAASPATAGNQQNKPKYIADRGDAARQLADEHVDGLQSAFYRDAMERVRQSLEDQGIERAIVLGPDRDRHRFMAEVPGDLAKHIRALLPSSKGDAPTAGNIEPLVRPTIERIEAEQDAQLLDAINERGVRGVESCLRALQEGRLYDLAVPSTLDGKVFRDPTTRYVTTEREQAAQLSDSAPEEVDLAQTLPELAGTFGVHLEFVTGEQEARVRDEFGGLGGLSRW